MSDYSTIENVYTIIEKAKKNLFDHVDIVLDAADATDQDGHAVDIALYNLLKAGSTVIIFYHSKMCPTKEDRVALKGKFLLEKRDQVKEKLEDEAFNRLMTKIDIAYNRHCKVILVVDDKLQQLFNAIPINFLANADERYASILSPLDHMTKPINLKECAQYLLARLTSEKLKIMPTFFGCHAYFRYLIEEMRLQSNATDKLMIEAIKDIPIPIMGGVAAGNNLTTLASPVRHGAATMNQFYDHISTEMSLDWFCSNGMEKQMYFCTNTACNNFAKYINGNYLVANEQRTGLIADLALANFKGMPDWKAIDYDTLAILALTAKFGESKEVIFEEMNLFRFKENAAILVLSGKKELDQMDFDQLSLYKLEGQEKINFTVSSFHKVNSLTFCGNVFERLAGVLLASPHQKVLSPEAELAKLDKILLQTKQELVQAKKEVVSYKTELNDAREFLVQKNKELLLKEKSIGSIDMIVADYKQQNAVLIKELKKKDIEIAQLKIERKREIVPTDDDDDGFISYLAGGLKSFWNDKN